DSSRLSRGFVLVARTRVGLVRLYDLVRIQPRSALSRDGAIVCGLLHLAFAIRWDSAVGFQRASREPDLVGYIIRRDRRCGVAAPVPVGTGFAQGTLLLDYGCADPQIALRKASREV